MVGVKRRELLLSDSNLLCMPETSLFRKRSGTVVDFDSDKIKNVILRALSADGGDESLAEPLTAKVVERLEKEGQKMQTSEHVQDLVEFVLIDSGHGDVAKSLIIYRYENRKIKDEKKALLNVKVLDPVAKKFGYNSLRVLAARCLAKKRQGGYCRDPDAVPRKGCDRRRPGRHIVF